MPFIISQGESSFSPVSPGRHLAVCIGVFDLGLQSAFGQTRPETYLRFEILDESVPDKGTPKIMGKYYRTSLHQDSTLRHHLKDWRDGRDITKEELARFDLFSMLGQPCQILVAESEDGDPHISTIAPWPKGAQKPDSTHSELLRYSPTDAGDLDRLPNFIKKKIASRVERRPPPASAKVPRPARSWIDDVEPGDDPPPPSQAPDGPAPDDEIIF